MVKQRTKNDDGRFISKNICICSKNLQLIITNLQKRRVIIFPSCFLVVTMELNSNYANRRMI